MCAVCDILFKRMRDGIFSESPCIFIEKYAVKYIVSA